MSKPDLLLFLEQKKKSWDAKRTDVKYPGFAVSRLNLVTFFGKGDSPGTWREKKTLAAHPGEVTTTFLSGVEITKSQTLSLQKVMKEENPQPRKLYVAWLSFKMTGESFLDKQSLKEFIKTGLLRNGEGTSSS